MNKNFPRALILVLVFIGLGWVIYHSLSNQESTRPDKKLYPGKISIGNVIWPGYSALYVADAKGFFKEAGLDVDIVNYDSMVGLSKDYVAGKLQGRANLTLEAINESLQGMKQKIVLAIDHSNGSDGIAAIKDITEFPQIKGRRVAFEYGTLEEFFLRYALEQHHLIFEDIIPFDRNPDSAAQSLVKGEVDVAVTYEPFLTEALNKVGGNLIYSSKNAPGLITDILTLRHELVDQYPDTVRALLKAYFRALDFLKQRPDEAHQIVAKVFKDTPENVAQQLKGVVLLDEHDNSVAFSFSPGVESLFGNLRKLKEFVLKRNRNNEQGQRIDTDALIDRRFIQEMTKAQQ